MVVQPLDKVAAAQTPADALALGTAAGRATVGTTQSSAFGTGAPGGMVLVVIVAPSAEYWLEVHLHQWCGCALKRTSPRLPVAAGAKLEGLRRTVELSGL